MPRAISRTSTANTVSVAVYQELRTLIVRGQLRPATRLTEVDVATQLQTSRTPAREALRRLRQEGLLVATGAENGGKVRLAVAPMTREEAEELFLSAGALEGVAARRIVELTPLEQRRLGATLAKAEAAFQHEAKRRQPDWNRLFDSHGTFHRLLVERLAGPRLHRLIDELRPHLERYEYVYGPLMGPNYGATYDEHAAIITAITAGDAQRSERAVRANWFGAAKRLATVVDRLGEATFLRGFEYADDSSR